MLILIDQDGVLSGFDQAVHSNLISRFPTERVIPLEQRKSFYYRGDYPPDMQAEIDDLMCTSGFHANLPVIPGSVEAAREMVDEGHDVFINTSPLTSSKTCASEKFGWVEEHMGSSWLQRLIITKDKTLVRGDLLYDDKPEITGLMLPTWRHVVVTQPYNRHVNTPYRVSSLADWRQALELIS